MNFSNTAAPWGRPLKALKTEILVREQVTGYRVDLVRQRDQFIPSYLSAFILGEAQLHQ